MSFIRKIVSLTMAVVSGLAFAAPGYEWEMKMEMDGMPFAMPAQKACTPEASKEPPVAKDDGECKILEKKATGNRFQWKAKCKDGTMVGDITSTPTSYNGTMKMTDNAGATTSMKMSGKRLGPCDYQDRSAEVVAGVKQGEDATRKMCADALVQMQGSVLTSGSCPKEKPAFCGKAQTFEGFDKLTGQFSAAHLDDPQVDKSLGLSGCGLSVKKLRPKMCATAASASNLGFVGRLCPAEKAALVKQHCEGRKYTSQIDARYQSFCARAASGYDSSATGSATQPGTGTGTGAGNPAMPALPTDVEQGVKLLKGLFGN